MKAILALSLLVLAIQAAEIDVAAYRQGLVDQLHLDTQAQNDATACYEALQTTVSDLDAVVEALSQGGEETLSAVLNLVSQVQNDLKVECQVYLVDLASYALQQTNGEDPAPIIQRNFDEYALYIIQQVAIWSDELEAGQDYLAGQTEGKIIQILLGDAQPVTLPLPEVNYTKVVPLDVYKFIDEYYRNSLMDLGITNYTEIDTVIECAQNVYEFSQLQQEVEQTGWTDEQVQNVVQKVYATAETCSGALNVQAELYGNAWEAFKNRPVLYALQILHNVALNGPYLEQLGAQINVDIAEGQYSAAGHDDAKAFKVIFGLEDE